MKDRERRCATAQEFADVDGPRYQGVDSAMGLLCAAEVCAGRYAEQ